MLTNRLSVMPPQSGKSADDGHDEGEVYGIVPLS